MGEGLGCARAGQVVGSLVFLCRCGGIWSSGELPVSGLSGGVLALCCVPLSFAACRSSWAAWRLLSEKRLSQSDGHGCGHVKGRACDLFAWP